MSTTAHRRALRTLTAALLPAMLAALLLAGSALAVAPDARAGSAKPGTPTATAPKGAITAVTPAFTWSRARRAARYEVRVYSGKQLLLKKTGLRQTNWTSAKALPTGVVLTWKVRASNARGAGAWSRSLEFTIIELAIGDVYGGGTVAYILQSGDSGYVTGQTHGLIAATADQTSNSGIRWALPNNQSTSVAGATNTAIGSGSANTTAIIAQNGAGQTYAAGLARAYRGGGYSDWYLPSKDELSKLRLNQAAIGGFHTEGVDLPYYWSSSQEAGTLGVAWHQDFASGLQSTYSKDGAWRVRAVRAF